MARQAWFPLWRSIGASTRCSSVEFLAGAGLERALTRGRLSTDLIGIPGKLRNGELKRDFERQSSHPSPLFCLCHHDRLYRSVKRRGNKRTPLTSKAHRVVKYESSFRL